MKIDFRSNTSGQKGRSRITQLPFPRKKSKKWKWFKKGLQENDFSVYKIINLKWKNVPHLWTKEEES